MPRMSKIQFKHRHQNQAAERNRRLSPRIAIPQRTKGMSDNDAYVTPSALSFRIAWSIVYGITPRVASGRRRYISKAHILPARQGLQTTKASIRAWRTETNNLLRPRASG